MGHFASHIEEDYPTDGLESFLWPEYEEPCTFCGGKGYREFPVPLEDPQFDPCPWGCDPMNDPAEPEVKVLDRDFTALEKSAMYADAMPENALADSQAALMRRANWDLVRLGLIDADWRDTGQRFPDQPTHEPITPGATWVPDPRPHRTGFFRAYIRPGLPRPNRRK